MPMPGPMANTTLNGSTSEYEQTLGLAIFEVVADLSSRRAGSISGYVGFVVN